MKNVWPQILVLFVLVVVENVTYTALVDVRNLVGQLIWICIEKNITTPPTAHTLFFYNGVIEGYFIFDAILMALFVRLLDKEKLAPAWIVFAFAVLSITYKLYLR